MDSVTYVVGGSKGIGRAVVDLLGPARCVILSRNPAEGPWRPFDLEWPDEELCESVRAMVEVCGPPAGLVLSAGMGAYLAPWEWSSKRVAEIVWRNGIGRIAAIRAFLRPLSRSKGRIVNVSSTVVEHPARGLGVYAGAHALVETFLRCESRGLHKLGVSWMNVRAGWTETDMTKELKPEIREKSESFIPLKRFARPSEIAQVVAYALRANEYLTGSTITVGGGI